MIIETAPSFPQQVINAAASAEAPTGATDDRAGLKRRDEIANMLRDMAHTALTRAELAAEYVDIVAQRHRGGQSDHPPAGGYQKANKYIKQAARELLMLGKTEEARRKFLERAVRVANISPEAKAAAKEAGLGDSVMALLEIAKAPTAELAISKIRELAERTRAPQRRRSTGAEALVTAEATDPNAARDPLPELSPEDAATTIPEVPAGLLSDVACNEAAAAIEALIDAVAEVKRAIDRWFPAIDDAGRREIATYVAGWSIDGIPEFLKRAA